MWYKKLANALSIQVLSYTDEGVLKVSINGKIYEYYNVSPYLKKRIETLLYVQNNIAAISTLRNLKQYQRLN